MLKKVAVAAMVMLLLPLRAQALERQDLLSLVAMPLAVAAVSEMTNVPASDLMDVVALLNDAAVPPPQFVEVVRYVPVALVTEVEGPTFVEFVRARETEGLRGSQLVTSIQERFRVYDLPDVEVVTPRVVEVDADFIPEIVRTRVAQVRAHPHGGPPGQLKKVAGVQTGAEIVHGTKPGRGHRDQHGDDEDGRVVTRVVTEPAPVVVLKPGKPEKHDKHDKHDKPGKHGGEGQGGGHGHGHGKGKGKG